MSALESYSCLDALIEPDQLAVTEQGSRCQLVSVVMTDDACQLDPAFAAITAEDARELAFELLCCAEHAERLSGQRESER
jgi:hypothetical protein